MPSRKHNLLTLHWGMGKGSNLAKNQNHSGHWGQLYPKFEKPLITPEKRAAFNKMSKEEQDDLKKIAGWISGATFDGSWRNKKNLRDRDLMTIDIDYPFPGILEHIEMELTGLSGLVGLWHSSRRHTPAEPRVRGLFPLSRKVSVDEYTALVRFAGYKIDKDMKTVDPVSYRPAQMMFMPTCSKDDAKHYFYYLQSENRHQVLDVDAWLEAINLEFGDWSDLSCLPRHPDEENFRKHAEKAEDPLLKKGIVGDFSRAYPDIEVGMELFIPDTYIATEVDGRYTYAGASSSSGAVIYEGKFLYSFHGTDPVNEQLVNLWDLVRIHKYGDEDTKDGDDYKRMSDRPSWKAMVEFVKQDKGYRKARNESKLGAIYEHFADVDEDEPAEDESEDSQGDQERDTQGPEREPDDDPDAADASDDAADGVDGGADEGGGRSDWRKRFDDEIEPEPGPAREKGPSAEKTARKRTWEKPPKEWLTTLIEYTDDGEVKATLANIKNILQFERRFWGKIGFNEFTQRLSLIGDIKPGFPGMRDIICKDRVNGDPWEDYMDGVIHYILEAARGDESPGYGMRVAVGDVRMAVEAVARSNRYHPIRERLMESQWDSTRRAESVFVRYFGEPDIPYIRDVAKMFFTAAVYRIMTPGLKWDNTLIIQGAQGCGKSTFCEVLGWRQYHGELHAKLDDPGRIAEQVGGAWILELPELASFSKVAAEHLKTFTRKKDDSWRMAFMHHVVQLPRQFVPIGTTNKKKVLKDETGNRTFLMLRVNVPRIDILAFEAEIDQIWAEAYQWYLEARAKEPVGSLNLDYRSKEAKDEGELRQEMARMELMEERHLREVLEWADRELTIRELFTEMGAQPKMLEKFAMDDPHDDDAPSNQFVRRTCFREKDIRETCFGQDRLSVNSQVDNNMQLVLDGLVAAGWYKTPTERYRFGSRRDGGIKGIWYERPGASGKDVVRGYEVAPDSEEDDVDIGDYV